MENRTKIFIFYFVLQRTNIEKINSFHKSLSGCHDSAHHKNKILFLKDNLKDCKVLFEWGNCTSHNYAIDDEVNERINRFELDYNSVVCHWSLSKPFLVVVFWRTLCSQFAWNSKFGSYRGPARKFILYTSMFGAAPNCSSKTQTARRQKKTQRSKERYAAKKK